MFMIQATSFFKKLFLSLTCVFHEISQYFCFYLKIGRLFRQLDIYSTCKYMFCSSGKEQSKFEGGSKLSQAKE